MAKQGFQNWSQTAATNASADATVNWAEGQAPSSINDSARAMMASLAKYRDDTGGTLVCGGTSTAYTLSISQSIASVADMDGLTLTFVVTPTNGDSPTLNVNSLGGYALKTNLNQVVPTGSMIDGNTYSATFIFAGPCWKVHNFYLNPFNVPIGGGMLYFGATVPNSSFAFANGAAISRTTYATLFGLIGTTYGVGDGSTTFNLPDLSGRVPAGKEAVASRLTATYFGGNSTVLGATGGLESHTLTTAQLAVTTPAGTISAITPAGTISTITPAGSLSGSSSGADTILVNGNAAQNLQGGTNGFGWSNNPVVKAISAALSWAGTFTGTPVTPTFTGTSVTPTFTGTSFGSGNAHNNVQPTITCNYIIRVL
ncbi:MAG: tail protein [Bradyrhizobium sp.]|nr:tail protein [Bradyrhizobium sp.]